LPIHFLAKDEYKKADTGFVERRQMFCVRQSVGGMPAASQPGGCLQSGFFENCLIIMIPCERYQYYPAVPVEF
jgi:hypothetical protein